MKLEAGLHEVGPTQTELGKHAAEARLERWRNDAREKGMSLADYANTILRKRFASIDLTAIRDNRGTVRNLDGHHKIYALHLLEEETGVRFPIRFAIIEDYKGKKFRKYASHFVEKLDSGYFGGKRGREAEELVRSLPATYVGLRDSPMRSVMGAVFRRMDLKGSRLDDYAQFRIGNRLMKAGLLEYLRKKGALAADEPLVKDSAASEALLHHVEAFLFANKKELAFFKKLARKGEGSMVRRKLSKAKKNHKKKPRPRTTARRRANRSRNVVRLPLPR